MISDAKRLDTGMKSGTVMQLGRGMKSGTGNEVRYRKTGTGTVKRHMSSKVLGNLIIYF